MSHKHDLVAPPDIIRRDFAEMDAEETLRCSWDVEELLLMQAIEGHAHEGHGAFHGRHYPNTTIDHIARALRRDPHAIRAARQALIDDIRRYAERVVAGERPELMDEEGVPLLTVSTLRHLHVDPEDVLRGLFLGGFRDDPDVRKVVEERTGWTIGGGRGYLVNTQVMERMGLDGYQLAKQAHEHELDHFRANGLIVGAEHAHDPNVQYMYIRHRVGPGASDDAAIVMAGKVWNLGVAVGVFLADAVDTLEKYVLEYGDKDREIAEYIRQNFKDLGMDWEDVYRLTFLAAVPEDQRDDVPDSSLRHLLRVDRKHDQCALESHLLYIQGRPYARMVLAHEGIPNHRFYAYVEERLAKAHEHGF